MQRIKIFLVITAAFGFLFGCGDNEAKDKLLAGNLNTASDNGVSTGGSNPTANRPVAQASAMAVQACYGSANAGSNNLAPLLTLAPATMPVPANITYDAATESYSYTEAAAAYGYALTYKVTFKDAGNETVAVFGTDNNNPNELTSEQILTNFLTVKTIIVNVTGTAGENSVVVNLTSSNGPWADMETDKIYNGSVAITNSYGTLNFTATNLLVEESDTGTVSEGNIISGTLTGTGVILGTSFSLNLSISNDVMTGTANVGGETIKLNLSYTGTQVIAGTYTDSTGTHDIEALSLVQ